MSKFELDTDDILGFKYAQYVSAVRGLAISNPAEYYKLRADTLKSVKTEAVGNLYKTLFAVLSQGTTMRGDAIGSGRFKLGEDNLIPGYPSPKINDFAINVASILGDHLNKVVDILLPDDFENIASRKLAIQGASKSIDI